MENLAGYEDYWYMFEGQWNKIITKLRQKFTMLTADDLLLDDDLFLLEGRQYEMLHRLAAKLGKTKEEILNLISELLNHKSHMQTS